VFSSRSRRLAEIGTPLPPSGTEVVMRRAVVLGASVAGLLAARVLSDHADEVVIIERDETGGTLPRPGVPQGTQIHAVLKAGETQLVRWFPGILDDAAAMGMVLPTPDTPISVTINGVRMPATPMRPTVLATRPFLESLIRTRTLAADNIKLVTGRAVGLEFDGDRVSGARYVPHNGADEVTERADFVVDAMGRSSRLVDWLADSGWSRPELVRMPIKLNYATCLFERDEQISDVVMAVAQLEIGGHRRGAVVNRVEGDRWILMLSGYDQDRPGRTVEELAAFCRQNFPPVFGDIAERARPVGEVVTYRQADSRRREFHAVDRFPAGLAAAGDTVASFNPVYGQGMTSATLHASCLSSYLCSGPDLDRPAKEYFDLVRVVVDAAWQTSTFADLELPHVDGPYPRGYRLTKRMSGLLLKASMSDRTVREQMSHVRGLLAHPDSLSRPGMLLRVLWHSMMPATR
jgi:2-polyprenyl-6-methoxyphenol hydroxylase-like FAD-dependent oxidoreductase